MPELIWLHTVSHLRFYARSRLVAGFALLVLGVWSLQLIPFYVMSSSGGRFAVLQSVAFQLTGISWFLAAALALFTASTAVRSRSVQLLLTCPVTPRVWLASILAAALAVSAAIQIAVVGITIGVSLAWDVPFQAGFVFMSLDSLFETAIVVSMLMAIGVAVHPVIGVLIVLLLNEQTFYWLDYVLQGVVASGEHGAWIGWLAQVTRAIHLALPMLDPFSNQLAEVEGSLRVPPGRWLYLLAAAAYSVGATAFFFILADMALRRRSLTT